MKRVWPGILWSLLLVSSTCCAVDFDKIAPVIFYYEGTAYHNNPKDPGGPTKYGWTLKTYRGMVDSHATIATLQDLTHTQAVWLYEKYWWKRFGASQLTDKDLAATLLLGQINLGPRRPTRLLQELTNDMCDDHMQEDGILGRKSAQSINACTEIWPGYAYVLFYYYSSNPDIARVWQWARRGLRKRVLHHVRN